MEPPGLGRCQHPTLKPAGREEGRMGAQLGRVMPGMRKGGKKAGEGEKKGRGRFSKWDSRGEEGEHVRWQSCTKPHRNFSADVVTLSQLKVLPQIRPITCAALKQSWGHAAETRFTTSQSSRVSDTRDLI